MKTLTRALIGGRSSADPRRIASVLSLFLAASLITGCSASAPSPPAPPSAWQATPAAPAGNDAQLIADAQTSSSVAPAVSSKDKISLTRNFYFVFDGSGSMAARPRGGNGDTAERSKIQGAKWAVHEFMKKVPDDVNLGLYVFDHYGPRQVLPLGSNNRAQFLAAIDRVHAGGSTPLGAAIATAAQQLTSQYKRQLGYGEFRLIVITDGEATDNLARGVSAAEKMQIPIYTIGFDMGSEHALRKNSIAYRSASSADQVEKALEEAGAELDVFDPASFSQQPAGKKAKQS